MNGRSISHWGIITWPDNEWARNVYVDAHGDVSMMEEGHAFQIMSQYFPLPKRSIRPWLKWGSFTID